MKHKTMSDVEKTNSEFDLDAFDMCALEKTADLLKDELDVAADMYLEDARVYINDIKEGLENDDIKKSTRASHTLKSNSKGFGLTAVSELAEAIDLLCKNSSLEAAMALFPQLQDAFNRAEKKLHATIKNVGS